VVTDKGKGDDTNSLENTSVYYERATQLSLILGWDTESLRYDSNDDDGHADECETTGFGKL
jgi:spore coat protein CotH